MWDSADMKLEGNGNIQERAFKSFNSSPPQEWEWKENETQFSTALLGQQKLNLHF